VELDDYVESNRNFTAMGYYDQKVDSTVGRIGWQVRLRVSRFEPYAQITYDQEFEGSKQANAWLQTVPGAGPYRVPGLAFDRYYVTALLGGAGSAWRCGQPPKGIDSVQAGSLPPG